VLSRRARNLGFWFAWRIGRYLNRFANLSFSQEGEDVLLDELAGYKRVTRGLYIDIGAHHPWRFSNTAMFYLRGWRGVNVDANPGSRLLFDRERQSDTNLECAVGSTAEVKTYFIYNDSALNGIDRDRRDELAKTNFRLLGTTTVKTQRLDTILDQHVGVLPEANFLSVDVEGYDLEVLRSNDWERYPFAWVLAECEGSNLEAMLQSQTCLYLKSLGYKARAKTGRTGIFSRTPRA
jgi:FkbM family methyltransferase